MKSNQYFLWQPAEQGAKLLKVFDHDTMITLPDKLGGRLLTEIGPYCFADRMPAFRGDLFLNEEKMEKEVLSRKINEHKLPPAVSGRAVEAAVLPDRVTKLHNAAFYNCRQLTLLSAGPNLVDIGSDVFTNDTRLSRLILRSPDDRKTGLPRILERISENLLVQFQIDGRVVSSLFFPEYYEWLEEVTPAHLFTRSVHGQGFRMRKAFSEGKISYERYDGCFPAALCEESAKSLLMIALNRLRYPKGLGSEAAGLYRNTVRRNLKEAWKMAVSDRDISLVDYLTCEFDSDGPVLDMARDLALEAQWGEGAARIIQARQKVKESRSFELDW